MNLRTIGCLILGFSVFCSVDADELADTVERIKPSIVGVGTLQRTRTPPVYFRGTGFVVGNGLQVLTNAHVLPAVLDESHHEVLVILIREKGQESIRLANNASLDSQHDLALLNITGQALPALKLGDSEKVREGDLYAFTGYPIGTVLGLYPVTHRGIISAITPIAIPAQQSLQLNNQLINRLQSPYQVFQLDATAYPGNSGSPLYDAKTGVVVGILNKVFVQETKENIIERPSGITYAIPIHYAELFLKRGTPP